MLICFWLLHERLTHSCQGGCLDNKLGSENAMILKLLDLQKIIDQFFDDGWVAIWPFDDL